MVEFLFTEDNNSVDSEEQPEYFYDVSTSNMLNNITFHNIIFVDLKYHLVFRHFISIFFLATLSFSIGSSLVFEIYNGPEYVSAEAATWEVFWKVGVLKIAVKILEKYL